MTRLPKDISDSIMTLEGAKATVRLLFSQVKTLEASLRNTQDELEVWRSKYHETDKKFGVLSSQLTTNVLAEIVKFVISGLVAGYGINLVSSGQFLFGSIIAIVAAVAYALVIITGNRTRN